MNDRDARGHFLPGNNASSEGGRARAARLDAERRRQIAREGGKAGFAALCEKWFGGDVQACKDFIGRRGAAVADEIAYAGSPIAKPTAYRRPVAPWEIPHDYEEIAF